jgi:hypothetical protein
MIDHRSRISEPGGSATLSVGEMKNKGAFSLEGTYIFYFNRITVTYDHRLRRNGHPVRSAIHKPQIGRLVVGWVTTSEYLLLYVFAPPFF